MPLRPRALTARLAAFKPVLRESEIAAWTGLSSERWRQLADRFPDLPRTPGLRAARARRRLGEFAGRALSSGAWDPLWEGPEPPRGPAVAASGSFFCAAVSLPGGVALLPLNAGEAGKPYLAASASVAVRSPVNALSTASRRSD